MRSAIFIISGLYIGGVEKSLINVLNKFIRDGWKCFVVLTRYDGCDLKMLPPDCEAFFLQNIDKVKENLYQPQREAGITKLKSHEFLKALAHFWYYLNIKLFGSAIRLYKHEFKKVPLPTSIHKKCNLSESHKHDLAIAFAGPDPFIDYYVATKINAKEKWGWIHFDISRYGVDRGIMKYAGERYTRINIVSKQAKQIFDAAFPGLSHKTFYEPNIIDEDNILKLSKEPLNMSQFGAKTVLLTVGRISEEKGHFIALEAISKMVKIGMRDFIWLFVGDGTDMTECKQRVNDLGLNGYVKFLGVKSNPYPYMANCDIYVQPSLHEGFCITLAEAKLFGKPIVSTDFTGAEEQLTDYHCAIMCKANDSESLSDAICQMVNNL